MRLLTAPGLRLEPLVAAHAREMFPLLADPAIYEFENAPPASEAWLLHRYQRLEQRAPADGSEAWLNWVIRLPTQDLACYVQATVLPGGLAFIAYELNSRYWRQGIGTRAVTAMLAELGGAYGVQQLLAVLKAANFRSRGLLLKLGFSAADAAWCGHHGCEPDELLLARPWAG
jgi:RimJ/RimL family protein N-acetyltransferase